MIEKIQPKAGLALLVVLITDLANSFNIGKNMTDLQVAEAAVVILKEYQDFKVDDFAFCFLKAKTNKYGKTFDRLDLQIICQWLDQFAADKQEQVDYYWQTQKQDSDTPLFSEGIPDEDSKENIHEFVPYIRLMINEIDERKKKIRETMPLEQRKMSPEQILMNSFINRFDKLCLQQRLKIKGGRFIKVHGKVMNVEDYMNYKAVLQPEKVKKYLYNKRLKKIRAYLKFRKERDKKLKAA